MAGILHTAAGQINADTAGLTHTGAEPQPGQAAAPTPGEIYHSIVNTAHGGLSSLFNFDVRPPAPVSAATERPTSASVGPNGGLVPAAVSQVLQGMRAPAPAPGPLPQPTVPGEGLPGYNQSVPITFPGAWEDTQTAVRKGWGGLRRWLGF